MAGILAIDIGSSRHVLYTSEASRERTNEYYPSIVFTPKRSRSFPNAIAFKRDCLFLCDCCPGNFIEAYKCNAYYDPNSMFSGKAMAQPSYTMSSIQNIDGKSVICFSEGKQMDVQVAFGLQLLFEYYCVLAGTDLHTDAVFSSIDDLIASSPSLSPIYAIPDDFEEDEVACLKSIQKGCGLPAACYVKESIANAVFCGSLVFKDLSQFEKREIVILDIGNSKASLSYVTVQNGAIRVEKCMSTKSVNGRVIQNLVYDHLTRECEAFHSPSVALELRRVVEKQIEKLSNADCEDVEFSIETLTGDDDFYEEMTREEFIAILRSGNVFAELRSFAHAFCESIRKLTADPESLYVVGSVTHIPEMVSEVFEELKGVGSEIELCKRADPLECSSRGAWTLLYGLMSGSLVVDARNGVWLTPEMEKRTGGSVLVSMRSEAEEKGEEKSQVKSEEKSQVKSEEKGELKDELKELKERMSEVKEEDKNEQPSHDNEENTDIINTIRATVKAIKEQEELRRALFQARRECAQLVSSIQDCLAKWTKGDLYDQMMGELTRLNNEVNHLSASTYSDVKKQLVELRDHVFSQNARRSSMTKENMWTQQNQVIPPIQQNQVTTPIQQKQVIPPTQQKQESTSIRQKFSFITSKLGFNSGRK